MTDSQLHAVLVYRIETRTSTPSFGGDSESGGIGVAAIVLAKYNRASQHETQIGTSADLDYGHAVSMVIADDPPIQPSETDTLGGFKVVQPGFHHVVYGADSDGLCLAVITAPTYPSRVAVQMLTELYVDFSAKFGETAKTADANSLSKKSKSMLQSHVKKYEDLEKVDKTIALQGRVDEVKAQMSDNITDALEGMENANVLVDKSEDLTNDASVFKERTDKLRRRMRCKNLKTTLILGGLILGIFAVILYSFIARERKD